MGLFRKKPAASAISYSVSVPDGRYGSTVTATVTPAPPNGANAWEAMWLDVDGYVGIDRVYTETLKIVDGKATLTLGPTLSWQGGPIDCVVTVGNYVVGQGGLPVLNVVASTTFHVVG